MTDDAIREIHGCLCRDKYSGKPDTIHAIEGDEYITLGGGLSGVNLTPWQARYLATKLYRLARRINHRAGQ